MLFFLLATDPIRYVGSQCCVIVDKIFVVVLPHVKLPSTVYMVIRTGFVSNGEHNVLRATGYTRPVSLFKIRSSVRAKYAKMSAKKLHSMITPVGMFWHILKLLCDLECSCRKL